MSASLRRFGDLEIDLSAYRVSLQGRPLALPYREYALLVYLSARPGQVIPRGRLMAEACGMHGAGGPRKLDEHMRHLKMLIERSGHSFITRAAGEAYCFTPPRDGVTQS